MQWFRISLTLLLLTLNDFETPSLQAQSTNLSLTNNGLFLKFESLRISGEDIMEGQVVSENILAPNRFGKARNAIRLDRVTPFQIQGLTNLPVGAEPRTYAFWVKPNLIASVPEAPEGYSVFFSYGNPAIIRGSMVAFMQIAGENRFSLHLGTGRKEPGESDRFVSAPISWDFDKWHHIIWTWNEGSGARCYLDGVAVPLIKEQQKPINTQTSRFQVGTFGPYGLNGSLDDIRI